MSDSTPQYIFSARHGLDIARALSISNEINAAIRVLEDTIRLFDEDDRLVIELERLRSLSDDLVGLDKYSQVVNERSTESRKVVDKEMSSRDLNYLDLRARELEEDEFDFMS